MESLGSWEPVGAEAALAAAGGGERWGTCPSRWWVWLAARCWRLDRQPHMHQAGTSNAPTALLAQRAQPAHRREGEPWWRDRVWDALPRSSFPASEGRASPTMRVQPLRGAQEHWAGSALMHLLRAPGVWPRPLTARVSPDGFGPPPPWLQGPL